MARNLKEIQEEILSLEDSEKTELLRALIEDIDSGNNQALDYEKKWIVEAQKRYKEIREGAVNTISAEDSIRSARTH